MQNKSGFDTTSCVWHQLLVLLPPLFRNSQMFSNSACTDGHKVYQTDKVVFECILNVCYMYGQCIYYTYIDINFAASTSFVLTTIVWRTRGMKCWLRIVKTDLSMVTNLKAEYFYVELHSPICRKLQQSLVSPQKTKLVLPFSHLMVCLLAFTTLSDMVLAQFYDISEKRWWSSRQGVYMA